MGLAEMGLTETVLKRTSGTLREAINEADVKREKARSELLTFLSYAPLRTKTVDSTVLELAYDYQRAYRDYQDLLNYWFDQIAKGE